MIKTLNIIYQLLFMPLMQSPCKFLLHADHYVYLFTESKVKYQAHLCRIINLTFVMLNHISLLAEYAISSTVPCGCDLGYLDQ